MSAALPTHVATDNEAIPNPSGRIPGDGPDMRHVMPIEDMLAELREFKFDAAGYVARWRAHLSAVGGSLLLHYARDGEKAVTLGMPCDPQVRHRNRWAYFLFADLDANDERRHVLMSTLERERLCWDERPINTAETTRAMRGFLRVGGRILVTPSGQVTEGGEMPPGWMDGPEWQRLDIAEAQHAYFELRRLYRADRQIKRAARMLGRRTDNGGLELKAQP